METDKQRDKRIYEDNLKALDIKADFSSEDIELVMNQTGCTKDKAIKVLKRTKGNLARTVLLITNE